MLFKAKDNKVIILGINEFTISLANNLSKNHEVIMLDKDELDNNYNVDAIIGKIERDLLTTLKEYKVKDISLFIAMTKNEEYNLFATQLAGEYGAENTIAMVFNPQYVNISSVNYIFSPYQLIINMTNSLVKETRLRNIKNLIPGKVSVTDFIVNTNDSFVNTRVKNFKLKDSKIIAVKRNGNTITPYADMKLLPSDIIYVLYKKGMVSNIIKQLWKKGKINKRVFIIGGNELAFIQAQYWYNIFNSVIVIESNLEKCNSLAERCDNILILHGEGIERNLLLDEGLTNDSIILAFDDNDFHNILTSYSAKKFGCKRVITLLNNNRYKEIASTLGLDNIISIPEIVSKHLLSHNKSKSNINKHFLGDDVYTSKILLNKKSLIVNKKISEISNKKNIIIGVVIRNNKAIIPEDDFIVKEADTIFIFFNKNMEIELYNIFRK